MLTKGNLLSALPTDLSVEQFEPLVVTPHVTIERIISHQHASPADFWYDQAQDEWVLLAQGAAVLEFDNAPALSLCAGDYVLIPAHQRHRVASTAPETIWLAIHIYANAKNECAENEQPC